MLEPPQVFNASADNLDVDTKVSGEARNQGLGRRADGCSPQTQGVESVHEWPDALSPAEPGEETNLSFAPDARCRYVTEPLPTGETLRRFSSASAISAISCSRFRGSQEFTKPEISGQKPPGVIFRTFSINHLHQSFPDPCPVFLSRSALSAASCSRSAKLNKTEQKGRGVPKTNVVHQRFTITKNRTSFSFPPLFFVAHFVVHFIDLGRSLFGPWRPSTLDPRHRSRNGTFRDKTPPGQNETIDY